ncbi:TOBE domain-containing protein, partial [Sphingopyxis sp.]|uniref:TOBE domain-containing protein n=1 Tax=Sphingopyxis sp. TaxID=1908224 RepID=UPI002ED9EBCE
IEARVEELAYHGDHSRIRAALDGGGALVIRTSGAQEIAPGQRIPIGWCTDRCFAFPAEDHAALRQREVA